MTLKKQKTTSYNKYGNKKCEFGGFKFDSKKELERYLELLWLLKAGKIINLILQPRFDLFINGKKICTYVADFLYNEIGVEGTIVEDVKAMKTPVYNLKKKMFLASYPQYKFVEINVKK